MQNEKHETRYDEGDKVDAVVSPLERGVRQRMRPKHYAVTNYWLVYYCIDQCTLCGNRGRIDTTGTTTTAGVPVGRVNYCICPNGQALRGAGVTLSNVELTGRPY